MDSVPQKRCSKCKQYYPAIPEFFEVTTPRNGLHSWCRKCKADVKRQRRHDPSRRDKQLSLDKKYRDKARSTKEGRDRINSLKRAAYHNKPEYRQRRLDKEKERAKTTNFQNRRREYMREYIATEKGKAIKKSGEARRRARIRNLPCNFTNNDWMRCLEYFQYKCAVCGRCIDMWTTLSADHWIAVSDDRQDNPGTVPANIIPLCCAAKRGVPNSGYCNPSKKNKLATDWLIKTFGKRKGLNIAKRIDAYFEWVREQDEINYRGKRCA